MARCLLLLLAAHAVAARASSPASSTATRVRRSYVPNQGCAPAARPLFAEEAGYLDLGLGLGLAASRPAAPAAGERERSDDERWLDTHFVAARGRREEQAEQQAKQAEQQAEQAEQQAEQAEQLAEQQAERDHQAGPGGGLLDIERGLPGLGPIEEPTSPALMSWRLQGAGLAAGLEALLQGSAMGMYPPQDDSNPEPGNPWGSRPETEQRGERATRAAPRPRTHSRRGRRSPRPDDQREERDAAATLDVTGGSSAASPPAKDSKDPLGGTAWLLSRPKRQAHRQALDGLARQTPPLQHRAWRRPSRGETPASGCVAPAENSRALTAVLRMALRALQALPQGPGGRDGPLAWA